MHMVSRKTFNSAQLDTVQVSKKSDDGRYSHGEVLTKEEATGICQGIGFIRDSNALEDTLAWQFFHLENFAKINGIFTIGPVVKTPHLIKNGRKSIATRRTTYQSLSLAYRQALQAHRHLHISHMFIAGSRNSNGASRIKKK